MTRSSRRKKTKPQTKESPMPQIHVAEPARVRSTHVRDRTLSVVAGSPLGVRNRDWPVEIARDAGRLEGMDGMGEVRWLAIRDYDLLIDAAEIRSGRDSTALDIVSGGGGYPVTQGRSDAIRKLVSTDSFMPFKDRTIVRKLCEGYSLPGAVREACGDDFVHTVAARVRDALDALCDAVGKAKKAKYQFLMRSES